MDGIIGSDFLIGYIESHPLLYWQKYVEGVNMTYFSHPFNRTIKQTPKNDNTFYLETSVGEVLIIQFLVIFFPFIICYFYRESILKRAGMYRTGQSHISVH